MLYEYLIRVTVRRPGVQSARYRGIPHVPRSCLGVQPQLLVHTCRDVCVTYATHFWAYCLVTMQIVYIWCLQIRPYHFGVCCMQEIRMMLRYLGSLYCITIDLRFRQMFTWIQLTHVESISQYVVIIIFIPLLINNMYSFDISEFILCAQKAD